MSGWRRWIKGWLEAIRAAVALRALLRAERAGWRWVVFRSHCADDPFYVVTFSKARGQVIPFTGVALDGALTKARLWVREQQGLPPEASRHTPSPSPVRAHPESAVRSGPKTVTWHS